MSTQDDLDGKFIDEIKRVASEFAAPHADEVDRDARFPIEAAVALKEMKALGALVPTQYGGGGVSLRAIAQACYELSRGCSATGMAYAMHQAQVATILRHLEPGSWFENYLRQLTAEERLIGSVTSEVGVGGNMGRSIAAIEPGEDGTFHFEKQATTVSYGLQSDDLLTTVRRSPEAEQTDQVLVMHSMAQTELEMTSEWDTIGMRGTCSPAFTVKATFPAEQIMSAHYAAMLTETIVPITHVLWSHAWLGIATEAFQRGRAFARAASRRSTSEEPVASARKLASLMGDLRLLQSEVNSALEDFLVWDATDDRAPLSSMVAELRFNNLKLGATRQTQKICLEVLEAVGMAAYRNNTPYSVGRQLRDALAGPLQVANERLAAYDAGMVVVSRAV